MSRIPLFLLCLLPSSLAAQIPADLPPTRERVYLLETAEVSPDDLRRRFDAGTLALLEKLNRADVDHLARLPVRVVPAEPLGDEMSFSPFPLISEWATDYPKALLVDQPSQAFAAYEHGRLVRWGPISSGREEFPTPAGLFHLNWRSPGRRSTDNPDWFMAHYFNFQNDRGLAFHQLQLPGLPASHACIRLLERDARWLYDWGEGWTLDKRGWEVLDFGTPVLIQGQYDFGEPPPWRSTEWLARGVETPRASADGTADFKPGNYRPIPSISAP